LSWYVARALRGPGGESRRTRLRRAGAGFVAGALSVALLACGGDKERQDEAEPAGKYPVEIVSASFPPRQRLAETSFLRLGVTNAGEKELPALAITISIAGEEGEAALQPFSVRDPQPGLAIPDRPVWILESEYPQLAGTSENAGAQTANEKTFDFGALEPGETTEAVWKVTPVRPGSYTLTYRVDAGLHGKAVAVTEDGSPPAGSFAVTITDVPPQTRVNDAGQVVEIPSGGGQGRQGSGGGSGGGSGTG
jgi:hypothetical protein